MELFLNQKVQFCDCVSFNLKYRFSGYISFGIVFVSTAVLGNTQTVNVFHLKIAERQNLNQIPIWILDKRESLHTALIRAFMKLDTKLLEPFTSRVNIRNRDTNMTKTAFHRLAAWHTNLIRITS